MSSKWQSFIRAASVDASETDANWMTLMNWLVLEMQKNPVWLV